MANHNSHQSNSDSAFEVFVLSNTKGSNPGALCRLDTPRGNNDYYVKYCPGTSIPKEYGLNPQNQPEYEAITAQMAQSLGLAVPEFYVLLNRQKPVSFLKLDPNSYSLDPNRKCYFASKFIGQLPTAEREKPVFTEIFRREEIFRDILLIADIVGKRQNYALIESDGQSKVVYLDVGCSFVHVTGGIMKTFSCSKKALDASDRDEKKALSNLSKYLIETPNGGTLALDELANMPRDMRVPTLNPSGRFRLDSLISGPEIDTIVKILTLCMDHEVRRHKDSPHILRI